MVDLRPEVFGQVKNLLTKHMETEGERKAVVLPVISQWPGRGNIDWTGARDAFTVHLVQQLPGPLLASVLRSLLVGAEQTDQIEQLCQLVDPVGAATGTGVVPPVRIMPAPPPPPPGHGEVDFRPPGRAADTVTVDRLRAVSDAVGPPLALVMDLPLDVQPTLAAFAAGWEPVCWLDGASVLQLDAGPSTGSTAASTLAELPPGLLVVDFSAVRAEDLLDQIDEPRNPNGGLLPGLVAWAATRGHRLVLGLTRFVAAWLELDQLWRRSGLVYRSAELFTSEYGHHMAVCERLAGAPLPLPHVLGPLLSANSPALPGAVAALLRRAPRRRTPSVADEIALVLWLAGGLLEAGCYEPAYRLETWSRTRPGQQGLVPLSADLLFEPAGLTQNGVIGFTSSTSAVPARLRRATLTGPIGAGKTTALRDLEHRWSVPRAGEPSRSVPAYLPLYVPLRPDRGGLRAQIDEHLRAELPTWFEHDDERHDLGCHALVRRCGSLAGGTLAGLRHLTGSPLLFLLDDADQLTVAAPEQFRAELGELRTGDAEAATLLATRGDRLGWALQLGAVNLRELDEHQVAEFVTRRAGDPSLLELPSAHDRPITEALRNPLLLGLLCDLDLTAADLAHANLASVLGRFVARRTQRRWGAVETTRTWESWLPRIALELLVSNRDQHRVSTAEEEQLVADARLRGLLRARGDPAAVEFAFETLKDYFAARQLVTDLAQSDLPQVMEPLLRALDEDGSSGQWRDVCRILANLLPEPQANGLLELLARRGHPRVAHTCALERPLAPGEITAGTAELVDRIARRKSPTEDRIADARVLGAGDPRIVVGDPLATVVEVPQLPDGRPGYGIGRYPVTTVEYAAFVDDGGYQRRSLWSEPGWAWRQRDHVAAPRYWRNREVAIPNGPVIGVNVHEASAYCAWLGERHPGHTFRLPSAYEWDRAAHGNDQVFELTLAIAAGAHVSPRRQWVRRAGRTGPALWAAQLGVPLAELEPFRSDPQARDQIERVEALVSTFEGLLEPYREELEHGGGTPVGIFAPNQLGLHDLFGGPLQWCGTTMSLTSPTDRELTDLDGRTAPTAGTAVVVKGGVVPLGYAARDAVDAFASVWALLGGWFDPMVRFHRLGFRVSVRPRTS